MLLDEVLHGGVQVVVRGVFRSGCMICSRHASALLKTRQVPVQASAARVNLKAQCMPSHGAPQRSIW
jgi:hypothetical protein